MAHPKRKISKTRRDKRRTHYKASATTMYSCPNVVLRYNITEFVKNAELTEGNKQ